MRKQDDRRRSAGRDAAFLGLLLALALAPQLAAQQPRRTIGGGYVDPAQMLARLERGELSGIEAAFAEERRELLEGGTVESIDGSRSRYTDAQRQMLLDGVEGLGRKGNLGAIFVLGRIGADRSIPESAEIPGRLLRIYEQATRDLSKTVAVDWLGRLLRFSPPEAPEIVELLVSVATAAPGVEKGALRHERHVPGQVDPIVGLRALRKACEAGVPVLRRLYAERDRIQSYRVRRWVEELAEQGFPVPSSPKRSARIGVNTPGILPPPPPVGSIDCGQQ